MNNKEAWNYLQSKESERATALSFVLDFQLDELELSNLRYKFSDLKSTREYARKKTDLPMWEDLLFYSFLQTSPPKKRLTEGKIIIESDLSLETRKPLAQLTLKALRTRLSPLLILIETIANKERVDTKTISAYALMLISNESRHRETADFCKEIINGGNFSGRSQSMPIDKSTFLLDMLEIGRLKYKLSTSTIAQYRNNIILQNELEYIHNSSHSTIGIAISYKRILHQSISRIFETSSSN